MLVYVYVCLSVCFRLNDNVCVRACVHVCVFLYKQPSIKVSSVIDRYLGYQ